MKKRNTILFILTILCTGIFAVFAMNYYTLFGSEFSTSRLVNVTMHHPSSHTLNQKSFKKSIKLGAIGDILIHSTIYNDAKFANGYNFKPMLTEVKTLLETPDVTLANQETMIGGSDLGLSTYPQFNSPFEIVDALKDAGVDIVSIANNHTLDRGEKAIVNAITHYNKIGLPYVGAYQSLQDKNQWRIISSNGIKLGFLAYTYGTNGIPVPLGKNYLVNMIDNDVISRDIQKIKRLSDVVIVSMHWGNEYQRLPSNEQKTLAEKLANDGADIIIGHHPHVLQPMEWVTKKDGTKSFVAYSLGNFLSGQMRDYKDIGGILNIEIEREFSENKKQITIKNPSFTPTFVESFQNKNFRVVPLQDAEIIGEKQTKAVFAEINDHMNQWIGLNLQK